MRPGERIRLIRESAESLLARPWPEAQLTLDQFGFETYERDERYEFDEHAYFIRQTKDGKDDQLANLHEYLVGDDVAPTAQSGMAPWTASLPLRLFLSHVHAHREFVGNVKQILARRGIDGFVAHDDIHPSQQWREVIKAALSTCHAFVAFLHEGFHLSQWCDQEVGWALGRGIPVLTVRPAGVERRDGFLEEHQDLMADPQVTELWVADQILDTLLRDPRTEALGTRILAEAVVNSGSYNATRKFFGLIYNKPTIQDEQLRRLEYAAQTNRQVYDATFTPPGETAARPVPDLIEELVRHHAPAPSPAYIDEEPY